jgi:hypothetical protein
MILRRQTKLIFWVFELHIPYDIIRRVVGNKDIRKYKFMTQILAETELENSFPVRSIGVKIVFCSQNVYTEQVNSDKTSLPPWPYKLSGELTFLLSAAHIAEKDLSRWHCMYQILRGL